MVESEQTSVSIPAPNAASATAITNEDKALIVVFCLTSDETLRLVSNILRDGPWAAVSGLGINIRGRETTQFWSATAAQVAYSIPAPFLLYVASICFTNKVSFKKAVASFLSLVIAIVAWNLGQYYGEKFFGKYFSMSDKNAGYAASLSTALAEGAVQAFVYDAILALFGDQETKASYNQFRTNPGRTFLFFVNYFLTSSLGGAVWQLIYNAIFPNCVHTPNDCTDSTWKNTLGVGVAVAMGVAAANYFGSVVFKCFAQLLQLPASVVGETQRLLPPPSTQEPESLDDTNSVLRHASSLN